MNMRILNILITACFIVVFGNANTYGEEVLIVDDSPGSGTVFMFKSLSEKPSRLELARNVSHFSIKETGHFLLKDRSLGWFKGKVDSSLNVKQQELKCLGEMPLAMSADGTKIAWYDNELLRNSLIIQEYNENESRVIRRLSMDGIIWSPSWSPDGHSLAFFFGPPDADVNDGFSLLVWNVDIKDSEPVRIAPPSLPTRLTPLRQPAKWTPDGKSIMFEARYALSEPPNGTPRYIVSINGSNLKRSSLSPGGVWDMDGRRFYGLRQVNNDSKNIAVMENDVSENGEVRNLGAIRHMQIKGEPLSFAVSPYTMKVAYFQTDREIELYDATTEQTISLGQLKSQSGQLIFINPGIK